MHDAITEKATNEGYVEVQGETRNQIRLRCRCGQIIKKRRDSYMPGAHMVTCLVCHNSSREVELLGGALPHTAGQPAA